MNYSAYPYQPYPMIPNQNQIPNVLPTQNPIVQRKVDLVQGRAMAEVYAVEAGTEVVLVDMDNPVVYRKARGFDNVMQPMEVFDLKPHKDVEEKKVDLSGYVKSDDLDKLIDDRIKDEVDRRLSEISFAPKKVPAKKGE